MGQSVGDLVVNLGITGAEKTFGAVDGVRKGMKELGSTSLETKAMIVGAFYALERLFTSSGAFGIGMTNSKTLIGETSKTIQQYENNAQRLGVANGSMTQTLLKLKQAMVDLKFKGQAPEGMFWIHAVLGDAKVSDIDKYIKDPSFLFQRLRDYALKEKVPGLALDRLKSFIPDQNLIARIMQGHMGQDEIANSPFLSDAIITRLEKTGLAWNKLGIDIEGAFHSFASFRGADIAKEIDSLVAPTLRLVTALDKLAEKLHVFKLIGKSFEGIDLILESLTGDKKKSPSFRGNPGYQSGPDFWGGLFTPSSAARGSQLYQNIHAEINLHGVGPVANPEHYGEMIGKALKKEMKKAAGNFDQSTVK